MCKTDLYIYLQLDKRNHLFGPQSHYTLTSSNINNAKTHFLLLHNIQYVPHFLPPYDPSSWPHSDCLHVSEAFCFLRCDSLTCRRWTRRATERYQQSMPSPPNLPFIMLIWFPLMERFFKMASLYGFTYWLVNSWPWVEHHSCRWLSGSWDGCSARNWLQGNAA